MLTFTQRNPADTNGEITFSLALTAQERTRSRYRFVMEDGEEVFLRLPRGTVLHDGDILTDTTHSNLMRILAKPEPVYTVVGETGLLLRAAYHLGNRHVSIEIKPDYLRFSPDAVLRTMLERLGLEIREEVAPFQPESGAYGQNHHSH